MTATCPCCGDALPAAERLGLSVDPEGLGVAWRGRGLRFTRTEAKLLYQLVKRGRSSVEAFIISSMSAEGAMEDSLRVHISRIRRKLIEQRVPLVVTTVWGFGYELKMESPPC